ncbi:putative uncharacterized protein DDB_G0277255 isoform X2 [Gordionus sp. m RMFG-2023]
MKHVPPELFGTLLIGQEYITPIDECNTEDASFKYSKWICLKCDTGFSNKTSLSTHQMIDHLSCKDHYVAYLSESRPNLFESLLAFLVQNAKTSPDGIVRLPAKAKKCIYDSYLTSEYHELGLSFLSGNSDQETNGDGEEGEGVKNSITYWKDKMPRKFKDQPILDTVADILEKYRALPPIVPQSTSQHNETPSRPTPSSMFSFDSASSTRSALESAYSLNHVLGESIMSMRKNLKNETRITSRLKGNYEKLAELLTSLLNEKSLQVFFGKRIQASMDNKQISALNKSTSSTTATEQSLKPSSAPENISASTSITSNAPSLLQRYMKFEMLKKRAKKDKLERLLNKSLEEGNIAKIGQGSSNSKKNKKLRTEEESSKLMPKEIQDNTINSTGDSESKFTEDNQANVVTDSKELSKVDRRQDSPHLVPHRSTESPHKSPSSSSSSSTSSNKSSRSSSKTTSKGSRNSINYGASPKYEHYETDNKYETVQNNFKQFDQQNALMRMMMMSQLGNDPDTTSAVLQKLLLGLVSQNPSFVAPSFFDHPSLNDSNNFIPSDFGYQNSGMAAFGNVYDLTNRFPSQPNVFTPTTNNLDNFNRNYYNNANTLNDTPQFNNNDVNRYTQQRDTEKYEIDERDFVYDDQNENISPFGYDYDNDYDGPSIHSPQYVYSDRVGGFVQIDDESYCLMDELYNDVRRTNKRQ